MPLSRRDFLRLSALGSASALLTACGAKIAAVRASTTLPPPSPTPTPTATPLPIATAMPRFARKEWTSGLPYGIPDVPVAVNVRDFGAVGDGRTDDAFAFRSAIRAAKAGAVLIPAGSYALLSPLTISGSVTLRGEGAGSTHLLFNLEGLDADAIRIRRDAVGEWVPLESGFERGSGTLTPADASTFSPGTFVELQQDNDARLMYTDPNWVQPWAEGAVGEVALVTDVSDGSLRLLEPLRSDYREGLHPQARTIDMVQYAGIEDLHIKRLDDAPEEKRGNIISLWNAAYCWLRNVDSERTSQAHVELFISYGCEVRGSFFHHASDFGGGGAGYGVNLVRHATRCLVEDNVFQRLRHSLVAHIGATGNVVGYNYSRDPHATSGTWEGTLPDLSMHGHYPSYNLFEGNIVQEIGISDYWGPVGPGNTYIRNRVETQGIFVRDHSNGQIIVGNEVPFGIIDIDRTVKGTQLIGNRARVRNAVASPQSPPYLAASYYHDGRPHFYGAMPWPSVGADSPGGTNPAKERYRAGAPIGGP